MAALSPGTPSWVDLSTSDLADAKRFYSELFGWSVDPLPNIDAGGYTFFRKDGKAVAGAGPLMVEGQPTAWTTYVSTDDADGVAARVATAGGTVLAAPFDVLDQGRMGAFLDPTGAAFSIWQPKAMRGGELFNDPGALTWNELLTRDPDAAKAFYGSVFGWTSEDMSIGPATYTVWRCDDRPVGGMMPMVGDGWPDDAPPHWLVYFAVEDVDATAARAEQLGGSIKVAPQNITQGRFAVFNDPQDAVLAIIKRR